MIPSMLELSGDHLFPTDDFEPMPEHLIALARTTAITGTSTSPKALTKASEAAQNLSEDDLPDVKNAFLTALRDGAKPHNFLYTLSIADALEQTFPQLAALQSIPAGPPEYHEEGDALKHTLLVMEEYHALNPNDVTGLLGALAHDLGKAETPADDYPHHYGHAKAGVGPVDNLVEHLGLQEYELAMKQAAKHHMRTADLLEMRHSKVIDLITTLEQSSGYGIDRQLTLLEADGLGRYPQTELDRNEYETLIEAAFTAIDVVDEQYVREKHPDIAPEHVSGQLISDRVHKMREYLS